MKMSNNVGFTLIELLVVVLIIGILAAIALPQYQKAVERSRVAEALQVLGDLAMAQSIHYMQKNEFASSLETLNAEDIQVTDAGDAWEPVSFAVAIVLAGTHGGAGKKMTLVRADGMYSGGKLEITTFPDGGIEKKCYYPSGKAAFCDLSASAGYSANQIRAPRDPD